MTTPTMGWSQRLSLTQIGVLATLYPAVWGLGQLATGPLSDRHGRRPFIVAMVYPTLLAAIGDIAYPSWRARAVGVYRLWRDGGFAVGALLAGILADAVSITAAIWVVAALTAASGLVLIVRMYETHPRAGGCAGG